MNTLVSWGKAPKKPVGKWVVHAKGGPGQSYEISVLREDNEHGILSYGWDDANKHILSGSGGPCNYKVNKYVWEGLLAVAQKEAARLNSEEKK